MLINVGARTDIINHYSAWLAERFREGYAFTRNPVFPNHITRYILSPGKVDAVLFCSKNYAPALGMLPALLRQYRTYFYYTVTAYGKDIEPNIPDLSERIKTLRELSRMVGRERLVWRYDPVLFCSAYPLERHISAFTYLCEQLAPHVSHCIFSFAELYARACAAIGGVIHPNAAQKDDAAKAFAAIAKRYGVRLQTCTSRDTYPQYGIETRGCATLTAIGEANKCRFRALPHKGMRIGCLCIISRDLGWYNSCPNLCRYCNANRVPAEEVLNNVRLHDPHSPLLIGYPSADDTVIEGRQESFLQGNERQISLFE